MLECAQLFSDKVARQILAVRLGLPTERRGRRRDFFFPTSLFLEEYGWIRDP